MNSDPLLRSLARVAGEDAMLENENNRWEALARGELSVEEETEMKRQALADPTVAALYEAFRPLTSDTKARIAERLAEEGPSSVSSSIPTSNARVASVVRMDTW